MSTKGLIRSVVLFGSVLICFGLDDKIFFPDLSDLFAFEASNEPMNWVEALQFCETRGSSLVEIRDAVQRDKVKDFLSKLNFNLFGDRYYWIGLTDLFHEGVYRWGNDCTPLTFSDWSIGEPNDKDGRSDCVHLEHSGKERRWSDVPCTAQMYALCQRV